MNELEQYAGYDAVDTILTEELKKNGAKLLGLKKQNSPQL